MFLRQASLRRALPGILIAIALTVSLIGTAQANHKINSQTINLEVTPETSQNTTGSTQTLYANLMAGETGNAVTTAESPQAANQAGHRVEVDFEIESGPAARVQADATAPPERTTDDGNTRQTPDMTCIVAPTATFCTVQFTSDVSGTQTIRAWVDDDEDNTTFPGSTSAPSDGDATEGRNAGPSDCVAPGPGDPPPDDNPNDCPAPGQPGERSERDDTDVVAVRWVRAVPNVCMDAEPEAATVISGNEHFVTVQVTDGSRTGDPDTAPPDPQGNRFDCSGQPISGASVVIDLDNPGDDNPDIFISSINGASTGGPSFGGPDEATAESNSNGFVTFGIRLVDPNSTGTNDPIALTVEGAPGGADDSDNVAVTWQPTTATLNASPNTDTNEVNRSHEMLVHMQDQGGNPLANRQVDARVTAGPHADNNLDNNALTPGGYIGECTTNNVGDCTISYVGPEQGTDTIRLWHDADGDDVDDGTVTEPGESINATWVAAGLGTSRVRLDMEGCNGDRVAPIDEPSWEDTAQANAVNTIHTVCAERFNTNDQPQAGAVLMTMDQGPGNFVDCANTSRSLGRSLLAEEVAGAYAQACITSNTNGTTVITASSDGVSDTGGKPWTGVDARTISCSMDAPTHEAGSSAIVRCTARDRFNNPVPAEGITWLEDGPGRFEGTPQATTGTDGSAEARVSSVPSERGQQMVTGTLTDDLTGEPDTDECDRPANDPVSGAPAGVCSSTASHTWTPPPGPPPPECSDGDDNDNDGEVDFPDDPGCESDTDDDETDPPETIVVRSNVRNFGHGSPFTGNVAANEPRCERRRNVVVKKVEPGRDDKIGTDRTDRTGVFKVGHGGKPHGDGQFYAKVRRKRFRDASGDTFVCRPDRSGTITVR